MRAGPVGLERMAHPPRCWFSSTVLEIQQCAGYLAPLRRTVKHLVLRGRPGPSYLPLKRFQEMEIRDGHGSPADGRTGGEMRAGGAMRGESAFSREGVEGSETGGMARGWRAGGAAVVQRER
jgi:hypothetical protein